MISGKKFQKIKCFILVLDQETVKVVSSSHCFCLRAVFCARAFPRTPFLRVYFIVHAPFCCERIFARTHFLRSDSALLARLQ